MKNERKNIRNQNLIFIVTIILMSIYLLWRMFFTLPINQGILNIIFGLLLIGAETITVLTTFELFFLKMRKNQAKLKMPHIPEKFYPHVDVFIATHNEPVDLLYKTVNACTFMEYPDKQKVHIYLCDDGGRPEVEQLAKQLRVGYLGFPNNKDAKSGNLNNAISKTKSPLIATFDADMIPQSSFLMKTVPYFFLPKVIEEDGRWRFRKENEIDENFKVGLIQTPQSFYNPDLFQFNLYSEQGIPNEQDFFSREINIMRNSSNSAAYTGSNAVILRKAMKEIGGFPLNTITEDFEVSIRLQQEGYITYATDEVQAAGLTTTTFESMIKQRIRWARGIIQSLRNTRAIFSRKLSFSSRITYLTSFLYWWSFFNRLIFILAPILFALFDFQIVETTFWAIVIFWLPAYFFYSLAMRYLSSNIRNQRWSQIIDTIFMPYLIIPVLLETVGIKERKFKVTDKSETSNDGRLYSIKYMLPYLILLTLSVLALIRFVSGKYGMAIFFSSIIIYWLIYNMTALFYAIFFMFGRYSYRSSERLRADAKAIVSFNGQKYNAKTGDVSENGISLIFNDPAHIPRDAQFSINVKTDIYEANLKGEVVYSRKINDVWRCAAKVNPVDELNKRQYLQIIYDRRHSLPEKLNVWDTAFDDIQRNLQARLTRLFSGKPKKPNLKT